MTNEEYLKKKAEEWKRNNPNIEPKDVGLIKNKKPDDFNAWDIAKDMAMSIPEGLVNVAEFTGDYIERNFPEVTKKTRRLRFDGWGDGEVKMNDFIPRILSGAEREEALRNFNPNDRQMFHVHKPETAPGQMTEAMSRFVFGMLGPSKFLKGMGLGGTVVKAGIRGTTAGAIADATIWDPNEGRLSDFLVESDSILLNNAVTQYLASDEDDTANEAALKNVLEGLVIGAPLEILMGIKAIKNARKTKDFNKKEEIYKETGEAIKSKQKITKIAKTRNELIEKSKELANEVDGKKIEKLQKEIVKLSKKVSKVDFKDNKAINIKKIDKSLKVSKKTAKKDTESFLSSILNPKAFRSGTHVMRTIDQIAENFDEPLKAYLKSDVLTNAAAKDLAKILATTPEALLKALPKATADADQAVIRMLATKQVLNDLAVQFQKVSTTWAKAFGTDRKKWTPAALEEVAKYTQIIRETTTALKKQVRGAARTTQAGNVKNLSGTGQVIDVQKVSDTILNFKGDAVTIANKVAKLKTAEDIIDAAGKTRAQKVIEVTNSIYINSLLSGIWTNAVNMTSGLYEIAYRPLEMIGGGAANRDARSVALGFAQFRGYVMNAKQTLRMTALAFRQGDAVLDPLMRTQDNLEIRGGKAVKPISGDNLGFHGKTGTIVDWLGRFLELPSRLLMSGDELLKQINFNGYLYREAVANSLDKGFRYGTTEFNKNVENIMNSGLLPNGKANVEIPMVAKAVEEARVSTFTNNLKDGSYRNWGSNIENFFNRMPEFRFMAPFIRTPTNLWRHYGNRVPGLGFFTKQNQDLWKSGDPRARSEVIGRQMIGMAATVYALDMANSYVEIKDDDGKVIGKLPKITGRGPRDKETQNIWRKTGWQPYSILIDEGNGKYVYKAYNRLDPRFYVQGIVADMAENIRNINEEDKYPLWAAAVLSVMRGIGDKSYTRGIAEVAELMGDLTPKGLERFIGNTASNFIPYASLRNQGIPFIAPKDKNVYETRDWVDSITSKTPFMGGDLELKRDAFGEIIQKKTTGFYNNIDGWGSIFMGPFGIGLKSELDTDKKWVMEIASLKVPLSPPSPIKFKIVDLRDFKNKKRETDGKQSAYDYWQEQIGVVTLDGKTITEYLEKKMSGRSWERRKSGDLNFDGGKEMLIKKWHAAFVRKAYAEMLKKYPEVKEAIKQAQITKGNLKKSDTSGSRLDKNKQDLEKILLY